MAEENAKGVFVGTTSNGRFDVYVSYDALMAERENTPESEWPTADDWAMDFNGRGEATIVSHDGSPQNDPSQDEFWLGLVDEATADYQRRHREVRVGDRVFELEAWKTDAGMWSSSCRENEHAFYLGGEDDEDSETPEAALDHGEALLRDQIERGN